MDKQHHLIMAILLGMLVNLANCQPDPTRPIVPMDEYSAYSRVLDCFQCFNAGGRMCHHKNHSSMFYTIFSSNDGNGICCKSTVPNSGYCSGNDGEHICSMPSLDTAPDSRYRDVLSEGNRNYQMLAFCPMRNVESRNECGIRGSDNTNYQLFANETV